MQQVVKQVVKPPVGAPALREGNQDVVRERLRAPNMLGALTSCTCILHPALSRHLHKSELSDSLHEV